MFDFINKLKADRAERKAEAELRASLELECKKNQRGANQRGTKTSI